jgi:hypothetical protein
VSPVVTRELAVEVDDGRSVGVARDYERVVVSWFCGDRRSFIADDLREAVRNVERLIAHPDVWVELSDSDGKVFYATVVDDELLANTAPSRAASVPWGELKTALKRMGK